MSFACMARGWSARRPTGGRVIACMWNRCATECGRSHHIAVVIVVVVVSSLSTAMRFTRRGATCSASVRRARSRRARGARGLGRLGARRRGETAQTAAPARNLVKFLVRELSGSFRQTEFSRFSIRHIAHFSRPPGSLFISGRPPPRAGEATSPRSAGGYK